MYNVTTLSIFTVFSPPPPEKTPLALTSTTPDTPLVSATVDTWAMPCPNSGQGDLRLGVWAVVAAVLGWLVGLGTGGTVCTFFSLLNVKSRSRLQQILPRRFKDRFAIKKKGNG